MKCEIKPNILSYIIGAFLVFLGTIVLGLSIATLVALGAKMIVPSLCLLPLAFVLVKMGIAMMVNTLKIYDDEIVIREFMEKEQHIPIKEITSFENTGSKEYDGYRYYHSSYKKINRRLTIYCGEKEYLFKYNTESTSGGNEVMAFLEDLTNKRRSK